MQKILIVTDGKAGHENQSKALAEALGFRYDLIAVCYPIRLCKALSYAADAVGILTEKLFSSGTISDKYAAVICTGSTAFYPGKVIARKNKIPVAAILFPSGYRLNFDCIIAPAFDNPPTSNNIIEIPVNLTATNADFYEKGRTEFCRRHPQKKRSVAVIVGGPNSIATMTADEMKIHLDRVFDATAGFERWITTSRRTPTEVEHLIDSYPFDYKLIYSRDQFNPIPAFVSLCERLFVTADSTGMISEAVTRGKAHVEILMNLSDPQSKFARLIEGLVQDGSAHVFEGAVADANIKVSLDSAVAKARELLGLKLKTDCCSAYIARDHRR